MTILFFNVKIKHIIYYNMLPNRDYEVASKYKSKFYTQEQIIDKLEGYYLIPKSLWDNKLPKACWYRYISKSKGFRTGGFLIKKDEKFFAFKNISQNFSWSVQRDDIACLYFKPRLNIKSHIIFLNLIT